MVELLLFAAIVAVILLIYYATTGNNNSSTNSSIIPPTNLPVTNKRKALSEFVIKEQIQHLPQVKVKYVIDGDTVLAHKGWGEIKIRLDSIDCPEDGQHWGDIAKYGLIKLISNKRVHIEEHGTDKYGRTLATIYIWHQQKNDWLNVNERMVTLGHAWVMRGLYDHLPPDRQNKLNQLERWARSKKVGLWKHENPTPPWEWRKKDGCTPL